MSCFPSDTLFRQRLERFVWRYFSVEDRFLIDIVWERINAAQKEASKKARAIALDKLAAYDQKLKI